MTVIDWAKKEAEVEISETDWAEVVHRTYTTKRDNEEYFAHISCEYTCPNIDTIVGVRILVDGQEKAFDASKVVASNVYKAFASLLLETLDSGPHVLELQAKTTNSAYPVKVRRVRLLVIKH